MKRFSRVVLCALALLTHSSFAASQLPAGFEKVATLPVEIHPIRFRPEGGGYFLGRLIFAEKRGLLFTQRTVFYFPELWEAGSPEFVELRVMRRDLWDLLSYKRMIRAPGSRRAALLMKMQITVGTGTIERAGLFNEKLVLDDRMLGASGTYEVLDPQRGHERETVTVDMDLAIPILKHPGSNGCKLWVTYYGGFIG